MRLCTPCNMSWPVIDVSVVVYAIWVVYQYTNSIIWWQDKLAWHCAVPMKMGCKYIQQTTIITTSNAPTQSWCSMCCILSTPWTASVAIWKDHASSRPSCSLRETDTSAVSECRFSAPCVLNLVCTSAQALRSQSFVHTIVHY